MVDGEESEDEDGIGEPARDAIRSAKDTIRHAEEAIRNFRSNLRFRYRAIIVIIFAVVLSFIVDLIRGVIGTTIMAVSGYIDALLSTQISAFSIVLFIAYLQIMNMVLLIIGFNGLANQLGNMRGDEVAADGGKPAQSNIALRWLWIPLVVLGAAIGALIGQPYGTMWMFIGAALAALISHEIYRRAMDGTLFGGFF